MDITVWMEHVDRTLDELRERLDAAEKKLFEKNLTGSQDSIVEETEKVFSICPKVTGDTDSAPPSRTTSAMSTSSISIEDAEKRFCGYFLAEMKKLKDSKEPLNISVDLLVSYSCQLFTKVYEGMTVSKKDVSTVAGALEGLQETVKVFSDPACTCAEEKEAKSCLLWSRAVTLRRTKDLYAFPMIRKCR